MKLGEIIYKYRTDNDMSQRQFAIRCKLSNGYIAMLESGINPATKKPIRPSLEIIKQVASAMNMTTDSLIRMLDGELYVQLSAERDRELEPYDDFIDNMSELDFELFRRYQSITDDQKRAVIQMIQSFSKPE